MYYNVTLTLSLSYLCMYLHNKKNEILPTIGRIEASKQCACAGDPAMARPGGLHITLSMQSKQCAEKSKSNKRRLMSTSRREQEEEMRAKPKGAFGQNEGS